LNAFSFETAEKIAGLAYPLDNLKKVCKYIAKKADILLAPVWLHEINDKDIEEIIKFSSELKKIRPQQKVPFIGIQNFLEYDHGRKPVKEQSWEKFFDYIEKLEKKHKIHLKLSRGDFGIVPAKSKKFFKKDDVVDAIIVCSGMFKHEMLCVASDKIIAVNTDKKEGKRIRVKITRDKYNVFYAKEI
jgi:uncharacterized Fe-S cluster-containing radical SAM superfamily enzyme